MHNNSPFKPEISCCHGSRKRKDHDTEDDCESEEICGQECKTSKSEYESGDVVHKYLRNWIDALSKEKPMDQNVVESNNLDSELSWSTSFSSLSDIPIDNQSQETLGENSEFMVFTTGKHLEETYNVKENQRKSSPKKSKSQQITKKLQSLSSKIEEAGAQYEAKKGHRLSQADKMQDEALEHLKLEQVNLLLKQNSKSKKSWDSPVDKNGERRNFQKTRSRFSVKKSSEEDRDKIFRQMAEQRKIKERPENVEDMTLDQLLDEKNDMQKQLMEYEKVHGIQNRQTNTDIMTQVYERHRLVLRLIRRYSTTRWSISSLPEGGLFLDIIPEDGPINTDTVERRRSLETSGKKSKKDWEELSIVKLFYGSQSEEDDENICIENFSDNTEFHKMSQSELCTALKAMREEKRKYKKEIQVFEDKFKEEHRRSMVKEDKDLLDVYRMYKELKPKIKLVDALLCKYSTVFLDH